ncbi:hypothetical protein GCM10027170_08810 [Aliiglaciecola aliphaticivorans]
MVLRLSQNQLVTNMPVQRWMSYNSFAYIVKQQGSIMLRSITLITFFSTMLPSVTFAENIEEASIRLCDHIKVCVKEKMVASDEVPPEMRAMVDGMVDNMCKSMMDVNAVKGNAEYEDSAIACIDSITKLSCEEIENAGQTPACVTFETELSERYPSLKN